VLALRTVELGGDWQAAWANYRRRRIQAWTVSLVVLAVLAGLLWLRERVPGLHDRLLLIFVASVSASCITSIRWAMFRCPRCGNPFNTVWRRSDPFRNRCRKCDLRVGEDPSKPA
jgi:hypothetical protein